MELFLHVGRSLLVGFIVGFISGFFLKEFIKIVVAVVVIGVVLVFLGISNGWIDPVWFSVSSVPEISLPDAWNFGPAVNWFMTNIPFGMSAMIGFLVGFKKG